MELQIVDSNLDYNIFLVRNWVYVTDTIVSCLFYMLCFPRGGIIAMIDQLAYSSNYPNASTESTIPLVKNTKKILRIQELEFIPFLWLLLIFHLMLLISMAFHPPRWYLYNVLLELFIFHMLGPSPLLQPHYNKGKWLEWLIL